MTTKPGEVYRVDLGASGKVRMMLVVSREDTDPPRALSLCVPITSAYRDSDYEVELPSRPFFRVKSYARTSKASRRFNITRCRDQLGRSTANHSSEFGKLFGSLSSCRPKAANKSEMASPIPFRVD